MQRPLGALERAVQFAEGLGCAVVAVDVAHLAGEAAEHLFVEMRRRANRIARVLSQLVERPFGFRYADDRTLELASPAHRIECGKDLLVREIATGTEQHQRVR